jgi:hypothetical protein
MVGYPKMVGFQGGEPLLHPNFVEMCIYAKSKIPKTQLGLWTTLPEGFEHYREIICDTFEHIFINDHTRNDVMHHPALVAIQEVILDKPTMWHHIDHCWAQMSWSASINPKGAFFCEIAAAMAILYNEEGGWPVEPGWWNRIPKDFKEQMEQFCPRCGFAAPLIRRPSVENIDDISPGVFAILQETSPKIKFGKYRLHSLKTGEDKRPVATYKDTAYRNEIAKRYGMFVAINSMMFWKPYLLKDYNPEQAKVAPRKSLFNIIKERNK